MILSNEPGYYKTDEYGIRIENLVLVEPRAIEGSEKPCLGFETLTFAPIERALVDAALLDADERAWLMAIMPRCSPGSARSWTGTEAVARGGVPPAMRRMTMRKSLILGGIAAIGLAAAGVYAKFAVPATPPMPAAQAAKLRATDFRLTAIDGAPLPLSRFRGKVVMLVNTASMCGFTPQYEALQRIQTEYKGKGFTVLGVPSAISPARNMPATARSRASANPSSGSISRWPKSPTWSVPMRCRSTNGPRRGSGPIRRPGGTSTNI